MVIDNIKNASLYYGLEGRIKTALEYLQNIDFINMECGRYEVDGVNIFALVSCYDTKQKKGGLYEGHRKYVDIQYVVEGMECMGYANINSMKMAGEYDEVNDFILFEGKGDFFLVPAGTFVIFSPQDVHLPEIAADKPSGVKKVIVKVIV